MIIIDSHYLHESIGELRNNLNFGFSWTLKLRTVLLTLQENINALIFMEMMSSIKLLNSSSIVLSCTVLRFVLTYVVSFNYAYTVTFFEARVADIRMYLPSASFIQAASITTLKR